MSDNIIVSVRGAQVIIPGVSKINNAGSSAVWYDVEAFLHAATRALEASSASQAQIAPLVTEMQILREDLGEQRKMNPDWENK